jgi:hypothetical protein
MVADGKNDQIRRLMRLELSDLTHLKKVNSPFQEILEVAYRSDR